MALRLRLCAVYTVAVCVLFTGCSVYVPATKLNSGAASDARNVRVGTSMLPEAKKSTLLYISLASGDVYVYTYPANKFVGQLYGITSPEGLCSDKSGHVFVPDTYLQEVAEYAHGDTQPIATFTQYGSDWGPISCAVDPATNNLAVQSDGSHDLYIVKDESSNATVYYNPYGFGYLGGTYDGSGNFFMRGSRYHISELPKGSPTFINIKVSRGINPPEGFAWDGKYLSITNGDTAGNTEYRIHVHGTHATIVSKTLLKGSRLVRQFTIYNHRFIAPDQFASQVTFWKYPVFGNPVGAIEDLTEPLGSAISVAH